MQLIPCVLLLAVAAADSQFQPESQSVGSLNYIPTIRTGTRSTQNINPATDLDQSRGSSSQITLRSARDTGSRTNFASSTPPRISFGSALSTPPRISFGSIPQPTANLRQNFGQGQNIAVFGRRQKQVKLQPSLNGEQPAVILLRQSFDQDLAGNYQYSYQLSNGQQVEEAGRIQPGTQPESGTIDQLGHFEYVSDDGNTYRVDYLANEGGFQPQAAHLPVAPAQIPEYAQLRQEHPELFWAEEGGAGANQQKFGKDGGQFFF